MAIQMIVDLYGCSEMIDDVDAIKDAARVAIEYVGARIVKECIHKFEPIGVTYFAIISTSHFSVHTWPEHGYAAVDIFSCSDEVVDGIAQKLQELFGAKKIKFRTIHRKFEEIETNLEEGEYDA